MIRRDPAADAWRRGDVEEAERLARSADMRFLIAYVRGRYEEALEHETSYRELVVEAYLHLGRPEEAVARARTVTPALARRVEHPLGVALAAPTTLPFAEHPLGALIPTVEATIDGTTVPVHLDTGGTFVVMGTERAAALGIELAGAGRGYHGVKATRMQHGVARELRLGEAVLTNVPVDALGSLTGAQDVIVVGTNVLEQFLATVDAPAGRVLLAPRGSEAEAGATEVPFLLFGDHSLIARGGFGNRSDLNFIVDSGFAYEIDGRQASMWARLGDYRAWGAPKAVADGRHFESPVPITLGPLEQHGAFVATTPRKPPWSSLGGIRVHALLSHAFLGRYAWTVDFDRRVLAFR
jgi:Aspartyl protease